MSPAAAIRCVKCDQILTKSAEMQRVRERGKLTGEVRCLNYEICMLRAERNRRTAIGMEEYK